MGKYNSVSNSLLVVISNSNKQMILLLIVYRCRRLDVTRSVNSKYLCSEYNDVSDVVEDNECGD